MNKKLLLILPLIAFLGACNNQPSGDKESSAVESSDVFVPSDIESEDESIEESSEDSSEDLSEEESSEETSIEESSEEELEATYATITPDLAPDPLNGSYPDGSTFETNEGATFSYDSIMKNTGKYSFDTIQFRSPKKGDAGRIENETPVKGTLEIAIVKNYVAYNQTDMSGELTVSVKSTKDGALREIEVVSLGDVDGIYYFTYETVSESYYVIENLSDYAVYATMIAWGE